MNSEFLAINNIKWHIPRFKCPSSICSFKSLLLSNFLLSVFANVEGPKIRLGRWLRDLLTSRLHQIRTISVTSPVLDREKQGPRESIRSASLNMSFEHSTSFFFTLWCTVKPWYSVFQDTGKNHALYRGSLYCQYINNFENTFWGQNLYALLVELC